MNINKSSRENLLHIGIYGKTNSGKSTLINALTGHHTAKVSSIAGTTTDPIYKLIDIYGVGPCVLIDTAGFDDIGYEEQLQVEKTRKAMERTDVALIVCSEEDIAQELNWAKEFKLHNTPVIMVINKIDQISNTDKMRNKIYEALKEEPIKISAISRIGIEKIREEIIRNIPEDFDEKNITGDLAEEGETVLLVMPEQILVSKGRLNTAQVQIIRELLDKKCIIQSCTFDKLEEALAAYLRPPKLIIADSQELWQVWEKKPEQSMLTSFSILYACYKGDIGYFMESVRAIGSLTAKSKVLIADACTHVPPSEDLGREKLPKLLKEKIGKDLSVDYVNGNDFPKELAGFDLVIQCGACMFNRKYVMSRVEQAKSQNVPMTNYGVALAYLYNILDKVVTA